jgi:hypothetical protein
MWGSILCLVLGSALLLGAVFLKRFYVGLKARVPVQPDLSSLFNRMIGTKGKAAWAYIGILFLIACQNQPPFKQPLMSNDIASGSIKIDVISPRTAEDQYWRYRLVPSLGQVGQSEAGRQVAVRGPASPFINGADCFQGADFTSPDHQFSARCFGEESRKAPQFTITALSTGRIIFRWAPSEWRGIDGFAWSPNSRSVALANYSEHYGKGVFDRFWAKAGHPVPYHTIYVDIIDVEHQVSAEYQIRKDVVTGSARILEWSD